MKITYWKCECLTDSDCYSIIEKTKRAAAQMRAEMDEPDRYTPPYKVVLEYDSTFELVKGLLSESRDVSLMANRLPSYLTS